MSCYCYFDSGYIHPDQICVSSTATTSDVNGLPGQLHTWMANQWVPVVNAADGADFRGLARGFSIENDVQQERHAPLSKKPARAKVASVHVAGFARRRRKQSGRFECQWCGADFTAKHNLEHHLNAHFNIKTHHCICGKSFGTGYSLKRHGKVCKGPPPLEADRSA